MQSAVATYSIQYDYCAITAITGVVALVNSVETGVTYVFVLSVVLFPLSLPLRTPSVARTAHPLQLQTFP